MNINPLVKVDFNVGSKCFERVADAKYLVYNTNYLIRYRVFGKSRIDYIATYKNNNNFEILYYRIARTCDNDAYNKWKLWEVCDIESNEYIVFNISDQITVFYLGKTGEFITKTRHPDKLSNNNNNNNKL
jgi:hypothetical protein